jgi:Domain of unknown function (DUF2014)/Helix-loop-helix DNA-binding domain
MASHIQPSPPLSQDMAGKDFDKWFDFNSATRIPDPSVSDLKLERPADPRVVFPISPLSITHGDFNSSSTHSYSLTAPSFHDLPTPSHSSSSPEARSSTDFRLSGETLRETLSITRPLKRKLSRNDVPSVQVDLDDPTPAVKKRPHNIIEKRYRANLNEKIAELRDSVPSLRSIKKAKAKDGSSSDTDREDLEGLTASNKLNKASILTKAVEYIRHLEFRTRRLEDENRSLKERLDTLDKVIARGGHDSQRATAFTSDEVIELSNTPDAENDTPSAGERSNSTPGPAQGLISMPDSWRRIRESQSQAHYGHVYDTAPRSALRGKWPTRIMLGSLAGLMVMEGFSESDQGTTSREKGLFGIPLELLDGWKFLRSPRLYLATFTNYCQAGGVLPLVKGFVALTFLAFLIFTYLFNSKPPAKEDLEGTADCSNQRPAPASPIEVRRRAWSTSMQTLGLPHHNFFSEWMALTAEWLNYTIRYLFGYQAYIWATGRSAEEDEARIKAWDIAIDAQLAGGDIEVSRSRVVLTSFGSGTLPRTPLRLMQKALHCRVLLWNIGRSGSLPFRSANAVARYFANRDWAHARTLHVQSLPTDQDPLTDNLAALLSMECDDVFTDIVVQRAYNLMYDRPTSEKSEDVLLDVVVEDHAIRSPLDAIAAWRSTCALKSVFETSLRCPGEIDHLQEQLELALRIAPPGSASEVRALAGFALYGSVNRSAYYLRASDMLHSNHQADPAAVDDHESRAPYFIDSSTPVSARADIKNCLTCAKSLLTLDDGYDMHEARNFFVLCAPEGQHASMLTTAAMQHVLAKHPSLKGQAVEVGSESPYIVPIADGLWRQPAVLQQQKRRQSNVSHDTGYESQEEEDVYHKHDPYYEERYDECMA